MEEVGWRVFRVWGVGVWEAQALMNDVGLLPHSAVVGVCNQVPVQLKAGLVRFLAPAITNESHCLV